MRRPAKILNLASALAALAAPAAAPANADAADSDGAHITTAPGERTHAESERSRPGDAEFMSFTVHHSSDGTLFPQHSSHSSHSSHVSHASSSPGFGVPDTPDAPYVPYVPPVYPPPVVAPPVTRRRLFPPNYAPPGQTTSPASDITTFACIQASNGLGVNEIASELERLYGVPADEAVNIAKQALASVLRRWALL